MAELTPEYIERMEDVLALYEKELNPLAPVVCLDEKSTQLLEDSRPEIPLKPGRTGKRDSEYIRRGTCNIFCGVEPKAGRHMTWVTKNRKADKFARVMMKISQCYPGARTIHLVMDNLNTHCEKSLVDYYGVKKGQTLWREFTVHYTPKHGSWLNQAEIEIGLFSRQCLGKDRIANIVTLAARAKAWNKRVNRRRVKINWTFTITKAKKMFKYRDNN